MGIAIDRHNALMRLTFSDFVIDLDEFSLRQDETRIAIEPQVFNVLVYLINHRDRVIGRDELMTELWAGKVVSDATLSSCIKDARNALGDNAKAQRFIATVHRRGYRFVGELSEQEDAAPTTDVADGNPFRSKGAPGLDRTTVAVLPFNCRSNSEEDFWLSDVLGEDLSIMLANVPGFWVISHTTMQSFRGQDYEVPALGQELGVQYLLEGNLLNVRGKYRISLQLIDSTNKQLLWADRHEFEDAELAAIQHEIAARIVASIEPAINRAELINLGQRR
ncbi:MAG: winged helix-turn-helix domain-containing protein, partial [Pseudomonadota bacterium]